jgi:hypothetical protein
MPGFLGVNRAVPNALLVNSEDPARLELASTSWRHLSRYLSLVEEAPEPHVGGTASAPALAELRSVVGEFGSPRQLDQRRRALLTDQPPENLHARIFWLIAGLHRSADFIAASLDGFPPAGGSLLQAKATLQQLGEAAAKARGAIGPLVEALKHFKSRILGANAALSEAYSRDAARLRLLQEEVGRLAAKSEGVQNEMARLGFFSSGKKHQLEQEIAALAGRQEEALREAEKLRRALSAIEPILNEGFWAESGIGDLVGGLDKLRSVLTAFGSAMTQLAADASEDQLRDTAAMAAALGKDAATHQWRAVAEAAQRFVEQNADDMAAPDPTPRSG